MEPAVYSGVLAVMCDASFRASKALTVAGVRALTGVCRECGQKVGAIVISPGIVRINFHERKEPEPAKHTGEFGRLLGWQDALVEEALEQRATTGTSTNESEVF